MNQEPQNSRLISSGLAIGLLVAMCLAAIGMGWFAMREHQRLAEAESAAASRLEAAVAQARKDGEAKAAPVQEQKVKPAVIAMGEAEKQELMSKVDALESEKASLAKAKSEIEAKLAETEKELTIWREQEAMQLQAQAAKREKQRLSAEARRLAMEAKSRQVDLGGGVMLELLRCPAGSFQMGSPEDEAGRNPDETRHTVTLTRPFWMGKFEVTQAQWTALMAKDLSAFKGPDLPVDTVSWHEAMAFCQKLTERERLAGRLQLEYEYRLPTEAEWEYACRAGSAAAYAGSGISDEMGWYDSNSGGKPQPVGQKRANAWGLCDMHGNVWEWCNDWEKEYPAEPAAEPRGPPTGSNRVIRGGSWFNPARNCRSATRNGNFPSYRMGIVGFRVALAPVIQPDR